MAPVALGAALATSAPAQALVEEKDHRAVSVGYVIDATRDHVKDCPKFADSENRSGCALYWREAAEQAGGGLARHPGHGSVSTLANREPSP